MPVLEKRGKDSAVRLVWATLYAGIILWKQMMIRMWQAGYDLGIYVSGRGRGSKIGQRKKLKGH